MIKPVLIYPRGPLKTPCLRPATHEAILAQLKADKGVLELILQDMWDTLDAIPVGVGLSSNQIGITDWAVSVIDPSKSDKGDELPPEQQKRFYMLYPEIVFHSEKKVVSEGCLSLPGYYENIARSEEVDVTYYTLDSIETGMAVNLPDAKGFLAQIIQHECDHLDGKCFIEHLSTMKQQMAVKKMTKLRKKIEDFQWTPRKE
jgi:peptide deformylase